MQQVRQLPTLQLNELASATLSGSATSRRLAVRLVFRCAAQGRGLSSLRSSLAQEVRAGFPPTIPVTFQDCIGSEVAALPSSRLTQLALAYESSRAAADAQARQLGESLAAQCLDRPNVLAAAREEFVSPIRSALRSGRVSPAFRDCVLHKAERINPGLLKRMMLHPTSARAMGFALGQRYGAECHAGGPTA